MNSRSPKSSPPNNFAWKWPLAYLAILLLTVAAAYLVRNKTQTDRAVASGRFLQSSHDVTIVNVKKIEDGFGQIYQNIRTISFLPSIRSIDRHGYNLAPDAKQSIQQIYNNLASTVAISEVYVLPVDFDPDKLDPATGKNEEPTLMFDVNEFADHSGEEEPAAGEELEEVETEEYGLLVDQLDWLKSRYPDLSHVRGINVPLVGGHEVITCDNTDYASTRKDSDRKGLMISVPIYNTTGELHGMVSAVLRTNLIRELLPTSDCALINKGYGLNIASKEPGQERLSQDAVSKAQADENLIYSEVLDVGIPDPRSSWVFWAGRPNEDFEQLSDVASINQFARLGYTGTILMGIFGVLGCWMMQRNARKMHELANNFENRVKFATDAILQNTLSLKRTAERMASLMQTSSSKVCSVANESNVASTNIQSIAVSIEEMSTVTVEISHRSSESSSIVQETVKNVGNAESSTKTLDQVNKQIGDIIVLIREIAGQINLLALNASIEASRAGEAGRGFSVVAHEVKVLANQTSEAANQVARQIKEVQSVSSDIVSTFQSIRESIHLVENSSSTIASAIVQQSTANNEISAAVSSFATGTSQITRDIGEVMAASNEADQAAKEVLCFVQGLSQEAADLGNEISQFLSEIRHDRSKKLVRK